MKNKLQNENLSAPCTQIQYKITQKDLPVVCPPLNERIWDGHPRVYLNINDNGKIICPYCGSEFILMDPI